MAQAACPPRCWRWAVEGGWVDRVVRLEGVRAEIAMVETPDGHGRLELTKFHAPSGRGGDQHAPANTSASENIRPRFLQPPELRGTRDVS